MKTHYELLGIEPTASPENIRASYLRAIAFYHPDRNKSKDAIEMTQLLNEAYDTLKDPRKKNDYDSMLLTRLLTGDPQQTPPQEPEPARQEPEPKPEAELNPIYKSIYKSIYKLIYKWIYKSIYKLTGVPHPHF